MRSPRDGDRLRLRPRRPRRSRSWRSSGRASAGVDGAAGMRAQRNAARRQRPRPQTRSMAMLTTECWFFMTFGARAYCEVWRRRKQALEVAAQICRDRRVDADRVERGELRVVDRLLPAAREERRIGAEQQPIGPDHRQRLAEDAPRASARDGTSSSCSSSTCRGGCSRTGPRPSAPRGRGRRRSAE